MKRIFLGGIALAVFMIEAAAAADVGPAPVYKAPPPLAPVFTWSGIYAGGNIGGAWSQNNLTDITQGIDFNNNGNSGVFIGGFQFGGNYQFPGSNFVIGIEWDADWAARQGNGGGVFVPALGQTFAVSSDDRWVTTLTARFGVAFDHWLFYGKAGGGWVGNNDFAINDVTTGASVTTLNNNTYSGWVVGAGVEWAFTNNWTAKLEYDYLGLSSQTTTVPLTSPILAGDTITTNTRDLEMVKVGINYLFNYGIAR